MIEDVGNKIYALRKDKGISAEEMGYRLDVSRQTIYNWERGKTILDAKKLLLICSQFDVTLDYFLKKEVMEQSGGKSPIAKKNSIMLAGIILLGIILSVTLGTIVFMAVVLACRIPFVLTLESILWIVVVFSIVGILLSFVLMIHYLDRYKS